MEGGETEDIEPRRWMMGQGVEGKIGLKEGQINDG